MSATVAPIKLDAEAVAKVIREAKSQSEFLLALYKMAVPGWEDIIEVKAYPTCSPDTWSAICKLIMDYDVQANKARDFDKQIMPGGCWMNSGFSTTNPGDGIELALWEVLPIPADKIVRKS